MESFYKIICVLCSIYFSGVGSIAPFVGVQYSEYSFVPLIRSKQSVPSGRQIDLKDMRFTFYNGSNPYEFTSYQLPSSTDLLSNPKYDKSLRTVIYIHGYIELISDESVFTVIDAYLSRPGKYNVISIDWSNMAYGNYILVAARVKKVSLGLGMKILELIEEGLEIEKLHIVGHSLGSHIAGYIGRHLKKNGVVLNRITGLDPAFPGFYPPIFGSPLTPEDARFVDAIHTGAGIYGTPVSTAQVDFWPNGGRDRQPGCPKVTIFFSDEDFCSHRRSWRYWAESVKFDKAFPAVKCPSQPRFDSGKCRGFSVGYMGEDASDSLRGDYFLNTSGDEPFSKGLKGIR